LRSLISITVIESSNIAAIALRAVNYPDLAGTCGVSNPVRRRLSLPIKIWFSPWLRGAFLVNRDTISALANLGAVSVTRGWHCRIQVLRRCSIWWSKT